MSKHQAKMTHAPSLKEVELYTILVRLKDLQGNRTKTARSLGIGLRTLQRKLERYGIHYQAGELGYKQIQEDSVILAEALIRELKGTKHG